MSATASPDRGADPREGGAAVTASRGRPFFARAPDPARMRNVALLRGINVGGNNVIRMTDLKSCFEALGLEDVRTFIQSGNVIFGSPERSVAKLSRAIERALSERFAYTASVVVVSARDLDAAVRGAPAGFGEEPGAYRYDVIFLRPPLTAAEAMESVSAKEGVDEAHAGKRVIYFSRLARKATQSQLRKIVATPAYKSMTIRNWNTTTRLLARVEERVSPSSWFRPCPSRIP